jgi:hypothetical protein
MSNVNAEALLMKGMNSHAKTLRNGSLPSCLVDHTDKIRQDTIVSLAGVDASPWSFPFYGNDTPKEHITLRPFLQQRIDNLSSDDEEEQSNLNDNSNSNSNSSATHMHLRSVGAKSKTDNASAEKPDSKKSSKETKSESKKALFIASLNNARREAEIASDASKAAEYADGVSRAIAFLRACISTLALGTLDGIDAFIKAEANDDLLGVYHEALKKALFTHVGEVNFANNVKTALTKDSYNLLRSCLTFDNWCSLFTKTNQLILLAGVREHISETFLVSIMVDQLPRIEPFAVIRLSMRSQISDNRAIVAARSNLSKFIHVITDALHAHNSLNCESTLDFGANSKPSAVKQGGGSGGGAGGGAPASNTGHTVVDDDSTLKESVLALEAKAKSLASPRAKPILLPHEDCYRFASGTCKANHLCRRRHSTATQPDYRIGGNGLFLPHLVKAIEGRLQKSENAA